MAETQEGRRVVAMANVRGVLARQPLSPRTCDLCKVDSTGLVRTNMMTRWGSPDPGRPSLTHHPFALCVLISRGGRLRSEKLVTRESPVQIPSQAGHLGSWKPPPPILISAMHP